MTYIRLANLAYMHAIHNWISWKDLLEYKPENETYKYHERESWKELKEIEEIVLRLEKENKNA